MGRRIDVSHDGTQPGLGRRRFMCSAATPPALSKHNLMGRNPARTRSKLQTKATIRGPSFDIFFQWSGVTLARVSHSLCLCGLKVWCYINFAALIFNAINSHAAPSTPRKVVSSVRYTTTRVRV